MNNVGRRNFLKAMGLAPLAGLPISIERALAIPANNQTGTIKDVEHIVVIMQENRSFDHYFGTLRGVRGFGDPRAVTLPSGKPVWYQTDGTTEQVPFRPNVKSVGSIFLSDPPHGWNDTHAAWNGGQHDQWIPNKGLVSMTSGARRDLPYHFALADAFTICDAYHCSLMGPTDPNRYHMWTGWVGNDGKAGGPVITNAEAGYDWYTFPERMEKAGISWKVYQDVGVGLNAAGFWGWTSDPYIGNYGDNSLLYFHQYQNAPAGSPLANKAKVGTNIAAANRNADLLFTQFQADVEQGKLPQVSYIVAPEAFTEHPNWAPDFGQWYVSKIIDILAAHPEVFSKTVVFLNYDEEGGFFDHMVPPTPPQNADEGLSTVSTVNEIYTAGGGHPSGPYGLGIRVPMLIISPWTKGGWVNSQVFDHTSIIRFIEARFNNPVLFETNITPWRRAVVGDLTSAFDFANPNSPKASLPSTASLKPTDYTVHPDYSLTARKNADIPKQEPGVRPARALPYTVNAHGVLQSNFNFKIDFVNTGAATAVFQVRSGSSTHKPRTYTVEPGKSLSDVWLLGSIGLANCDLSVYGPNGFFRSFDGSVSRLHDGQLDISTSYDKSKNAITISIRNTASSAVKVSIRDNYTGEKSNMTIGGGSTQTLTLSRTRFGGWYDYVVTTSSDSSIRYQIAGHIETGKASISDPMLGGESDDDDHGGHDDDDHHGHDDDDHDGHGGHDGRDDDDDHDGHGGHDGRDDDDDHDGHGGHGNH